MKKKVVITIIVTIVVLVVGIIWWQRPSDAEVLYAAGQVEFMGKDHVDILRHNNKEKPYVKSYFDLNLYTEWARQDPKVQAQIKKNRRNR